MITKSVEFTEAELNVIDIALILYRQNPKVQVGYLADSFAARVKVGNALVDITVEREGE